MAKRENLNPIKSNLPIEILQIRKESIPNSDYKRYNFSLYILDIYFGNYTTITDNLKSLKTKVIISVKNSISKSKLKREI